jgi:hypothetical protein
LVSFAGVAGFVLSGLALALFPALALRFVFLGLYHLRRWKTGKESPLLKWAARIGFLIGLSFGLYEGFRLLMFWGGLLTRLSG